MRKFFAAFLAVALIAASALCLTGCQSAANESNREKITVYLWSVDLLSEYAPYVESQLPNVDIEWVVGNNDLDFYKFYAENDQLPDIITTRRFSVNDAASLQPYLMDLSQTEIAATFYTTYLESYRNADGSVNWLPACGEVDGYIANKDLFDRYDIPLPTDYASFVAACQAFEAHGIRGFMSDFTYDYTCMEVLQGASIAQLQSIEGREWRMAYENGATAGLDDQVWPAAFERFETFINDTGLSAEDSKASYGEWRTAFVNEQVAIARGTGVDLGSLVAADGMNVVFLPYFGETEADNWVLTYPSFQAAISKNAEDSDARRNAALSVLEVMLSEEGQRRIAPNHSAIPYNKDVQLELAPELDTLAPYIESNHLYIRLASNEFFSASKEVVGKMLSGEYDAEQAYDAFDALLHAPEKKAEAICTFDTAIPYDSDAEGGNPASSSVANTLRETAGTELLIMPSYVCTGSLLDACYTQKALQFVIGPNTPNVFNVQLSGADVQKLAAALVEGGDGMKLDPFSVETLPVASGMELLVSKTEDGYVLDGITVDGNSIDPDRTYAVSFVDNASNAKAAYALAFGEGAPQELPTEAVQARPAWVEHITAGAQPAAPSSYLVLS